jgi:hypothetical protein
MAAAIGAKHQLGLSVKYQKVCCLNVKKPSTLDGFFIWYKWHNLNPNLDNGLMLYKKVIMRELRLLEQTNYSRTSPGLQSNFRCDYCYFLQVSLLLICDKSGRIAYIKNITVKQKTLID